MTYIIGLVQPNFRVGPESVNAYYLPYSVGTLWSYASQREFIKDKFTVGKIIFRRDPIEQTAEELSKFDIVAFSTYVWNKNYSYALAERIKQLNPDCTTIFGGPEIPVEDPDIFAKYSFMDIVIKLEGEETFTRVLENFGKDYRSIPGLLINDNGKIINTGNAPRLETLDDLPSPYLTGFFDQLMKDHPDIEWNATLETNRGCPYACTFCDWGSLTYNKVKKYPLERVFAEIEWVSQNKCGSLYIADANFGMFIDRDSEIIDRVIAATKTTGWPKVFNLTWAKNKKEDVVGMAKKWVDAKIRAPALTVSVQSLDDHVLELVKRKNMDMNRIEEIFQLCEKEGIPVNTELIMGLPGETLHSWKHNFWRLFDAGNHHGIDIYRSQLLENAEMNLTQRSIYKLEYVTVNDYLSNSSNDPHPEGVKVVTSTSTLPLDQMLEAQMFSWFIFTMHLSGVTSYISRFLKKYANISYEEFYNGLYEFLKQDSWFTQEESEIKDCYERWHQSGIIDHPGINGINIFGWNVIYTTRMKFYANNEYDKLFNLVGAYLERFKLDSELQSELLTLQRYRITDFNLIKQYPIVLQFKNNILGYILDDEPLNKTVTLLFNYPEDENRDVDMRTFLELLWYGRRREYGLTKITQK